MYSGVEIMSVFSDQVLRNRDNRDDLIGSGNPVLSTTKNVTCMAKLVRWATMYDATEFKLTDAQHVHVGANIEQVVILFLW